MGRTTFFMLEQEKKNEEERKTVSRKSGKEAKADQEEEINWEEEVSKYHTGGGWYDIPGYEKKMRKDDAIEVLKESDN